MFNRSEIMNSAWSTYRSSRRAHHVGFNLDDFAWHLRCAWHRAKMAALSGTEQRIAIVEQELDGLKYKPLRIDIATRRRALEAELSALRFG